MKVSDYKYRDIPLPSTDWCEPGEHEDFWLKPYMKYNGYEVRSITTYNNITEFAELEDFDYLEAEVIFSDESGDVYRCVIPARREGQDSQWEKLMLDVEVEDIVVRFSRKKSGSWFSPVWHRVLLDGEDMELKGDAIDWDLLYNKDGTVVYESRDEYDTDGLLYDAYEGDMDAWDCRNF